MTPETAVQNVYAAINGAGITRGDGTAAAVTDFEPLPDTIDRPLHIAVAFAGMDPDSYGVTVSLYADTSADVESAEKLIRSTVPTADTALDGLDAPRSAWIKTFSGDHNAFVARTTLAYGREDF